MVWTIDRIDDADYGCEERMPFEPLKVLVTLVSEDGRQVFLEVADQWLVMQGLDEGDEWPEDLAEQQPDEQKALMQSEWMERYQEALDELE